MVREVGAHVTTSWQRFMSRVRRIFMRFEDERTADSSRFNLVITLERDELDGGWIGYINDMPGVASEGETPEEAVENVVDALREVLIARLADVEETVQSREFKRSGQYEFRLVG